MKKFAFIVHPRDIKDMCRRIPLTKYLPDGIVALTIRNLRGRMGFTIWSHFDVYGKAEGWIIAVYLTGQQMLTLSPKYVHERILDAVLFAQDKLGASLIGLGAYTTPLTDGGRWLVKQDAIRCNITHGDSYSVAIALEGIEKICRSVNLDLKKVKLSCIGAYGLIGKALSKLMLSRCRTLVLVGRNRTKLEKLKQGLNNPENVLFTENVEDVSDSDIVVTATSYPGALLQSRHLKKGAIVYDLAQPINVVPSVCEERPDILRVDGCYTNIPGVDLKVDMGPPPGTTFSCLAETIMQALEEDDSDHVGEIELNHVERTKIWAQKYNFTHAELTNLGERILIDTK